jgi:hypothetical protein
MGWFFQRERKLATCCSVFVEILNKILRPEESPAMFPLLEDIKPAIGSLRQAVQKYFVLPTNFFLHVCP